MKIKDFKRMHIRFKLYTIIIFLLVLSINVQAQQKSGFTHNPLTLSQYLTGVVKGNLGYIAEQFSVTVSEAELKAAHVFPDPEISFAYTNNEDYKRQMGQEFESEISYPVSLGNKRKAGISLAKSKYELTQMLLGYYFQNMRADAALAYYVSLHEQKKYEIHLSIYDQLKKLARADSIRLKSGDATGLDAMQSSLEAKAYMAEVLQSLSEMQSSGMELMMLQGKKVSDTLDMASGNFPILAYDFTIGELTQMAVENRSELLAAIKSREVSEKNLNLLKANRAFEFNVGAGFAHNTIVLNEVSPSDPFNSLSAGISFPLKFSNMNRGELEAARAEIRQSETLFKDTELQVYTEVMQAYNNFVIQTKKAEQYSKDLTETAEKILQGRIYAYQRGETGLLDVLNAQRTYMDLQLNRLETQFDYTVALIEVQRAAGIWEIQE